MWEVICVDFSVYDERNSFPISFFLTFYAMALPSYKLCGKPLEYECDMEELRQGEQIDGIQLFEVL